MICRHSPGDPNCGSSPAGRARAEAENYSYEVERLKKQIAITPDAKNYIIQRAEMIGPHLVLQVQYPNCSKCAFEGLKTLVILNVDLINAMKWKEIDPHFRDPKLKGMHTQAPSPSARFPGTEDGWIDAKTYARSKNER